MLLGVLWTTLITIPICDSKCQLKQTKKLGTLSIVLLSKYFTNSYISYYKTSKLSLVITYDLKKDFLIEALRVNQIRT